MLKYFIDYLKKILNKSLELNVQFQLKLRKLINNLI